MSVVRSWVRNLRAACNAPRLHVALAGPWVRRREPATVRSILVIRPDQIGDFVLGAPLLRALKASHPHAALHVVVVAGLVDFARACPLVDTVTALPAGAAFWGPAPQAPVGRLLRLVWFAATRLRRLRPDIAIVPRVDIDAHGASLLVLASGAPRRVAFSTASSVGRSHDNAGFDAYFTDVVPPPGAVHEVTASRSLAAALGLTAVDWSLTMWDTPADGRAVDERLDRLGLRGQPLVVLAPGATFAFRRWPAESFAAVGRALASADNGFKVVIVGAGGDREAAAAIAARLPAGTCHDLTGSLSLGETTALLRRAKVFVGNDSGPLHLAAAAGLPCVEVSSFPRDGDPLHHNSPVRFGPWGVPHRILQPATARPPCRGACTAAEAHCILAIEPQRVVDAIHDVLSVNLPVPLETPP